MAEIENNTRRVTRGGGGGAIARANAARQAEAPAETETLRVSAARRASLNVVPDDQRLSSLVRQALEALSRGVRWARGSILNLIV